MFVPLHDDDTAAHDDDDADDASRDDMAGQRITPLFTPGAAEPDSVLDQVPRLFYARSVFSHCAHFSINPCMATRSLLRPPRSGASSHSWAIVCEGTLGASVRRGGIIYIFIREES